MSDDDLLPVPDDLGFVTPIAGFVAGQKLFGRYTLMRIIGRGGMGEVWLAQDEELRKEIALKFLPPTLELNASSLEEFKRETHRSRKLVHANIVKIYDFAYNDQAAAIAMEYVQGDTLSLLRVRQENRHFEVREIEDWIKQLLNALVYVHEEARIVHRDLKPCNIMVDREGRVKLTDFGIASIIIENFSHLSGYSIVYMSPQQLMGRPPSIEDDIYAFGTMIYELLTSRPPFYSGHAHPVLSQVREVVPPSMAQRRAELEIAGEPIRDEWEQAVAACLAKDPVKRPPSMAALAELLKLGDTLPKDSHAATNQPTLTTVSLASTRTVPQPTTALGPLAGQPWINSLGMKFVSAGTYGILFSTWAVRVQDFKAFVESTGYQQTGGIYVTKLNDAADHETRFVVWALDPQASWRQPGFEQGPTHPVVGVSWNEAKAFCEWLTDKERKEGTLGLYQSYRLTTDAEWSRAVGYGKYPWGVEWPPPQGVGNFLDEGFFVFQMMEDGRSRTNPVESFRPNAYGLYDMGGNVHQWCEDWYRKEMNSEEIRQEIPRLNNDGGGSAFKVLRGASWYSCSRDHVYLLTSYRRSDSPTARTDDNGFRVVVVVTP